MNRSKIIILFSIFVLSLFIRFYNYSNRINFSSEQGLALGVSSDFINEKFSLIGQQTFLRTTSKGHIIFSGALYNYSLMPFLVIFKYNPVPITVLFTLLNLSTGLILFILVKKMFDSKTAFLSLVIFSFNSTMIFHSMFIWILNYLPLIGVLTIYLLWNIRKNYDNNKILLIGILCGIGLNLEHFYIFTIFLVGYLILRIGKNKFRDILVFLGGITLANTTSIIFDLKHDFYQVKTLWQYLLDTFSNPSQSHISYYHFIQYWPLLIIISALLFKRLIKFNKTLGLIILAFYLLINLTSSNVSLTRAVGMSSGMTFAKLDLAAKTIANDNPQNFNLVNLPDSDFRAYSLRYLVKNLYNKKPEDIENYQNISSLYVFANKDFNLKNPQPWEISIFDATKQKKLIDLDETYGVYKLTKDE